MPPAILILLAFVLGCSGPNPVATPQVVEQQPAPAERANQTNAGREIVDEFQCTSCHEIETADGEALERPTGGRDCYGCHKTVTAGKFPDRPHMHEQWLRELPSKFDVPSLRGANRFQRSWLVGYLQNPHDVRHNLDSQMPRMPIRRDQAEAIADFLGAEDTTDEVAGEATRGAELYTTFNCAMCHGDHPNEIPRPVVLAPHLSRAHERLGPAGVAAWIVDPRAQKPDGLMPNLGVTSEQAADLSAYIATIAPPTRPAPLTRGPYRLDRIVPWKEVYRGLLRERCLHCHNKPESTGMGGPGYTGGWGYEGKSQSLFTYEQAMKGGRASDGTPRTLFDPVGKDGMPRLVAHLIARHQEVAGQRPEFVGMPLGQPPVPMQQIDAVYTWILQGRLP